MVQPYVLVPMTVYIVVDAGDAVGFGQFRQLGDGDEFQLYVPPTPAPSTSKDAV